MLHAKGDVNSPAYMRLLKLLVRLPCPLSNGCQDPGLVHGSRENVRGAKPIVPHDVHIRASTKRHSRFREISAAGMHGSMWLIASDSACRLKCGR